MLARCRPIVSADSRTFRRSMLATVLMSLVLTGNARGQQSSEPEPRVQELYAAAQAAKNRGDLTTAIEKYRSVLALAPTLAPAYNNLGLLYLDMRDYVKAAETFEAGLKRDPSMSPSLVGLGISYYQLQDYARAQPVLEKALRVLPKDEQAQMYLGLCLSKTGQLEEGAAVLQRLEKQSPKNLEALYSLGQLYMALAQQTLQKLQAAGPDSYLTYLVAGEAQERMEHYEDAVIQYKQAIQRQPPGYLGLRYRLGNAYWLGGKWQEAITAFKEEIADDPRNCMALWKIGNIMLINNQDSSEALSYLSRSIEVCPNLVQAIVDKARLVSDKGDHEAAVPLYERALELAPQEPMIHYQLALTYRKLHRMEEAKAEMDIVQKLRERQK